MTVTEAPNVAGAVETNARVATVLHPKGSYEVADHPVPTGKEEVWRFTPFRRLRGLQADAEFQPSAIECEWTSHEGVSIRSVGGTSEEADELRSLRGASGFLPNDRVTARILDEVPSSLLVDVAENAEVDGTVVVTLSGTDADVTEAGHIVLRFGANSRADVVLNHQGSTTIAQVVEVIAGDGSAVSVTTVQDWADDTVHLGFHHVSVGRDAKVKHTALTFGGDLVRISTSVDYAGPGGDAELLGLYYADAGQHLEHRIFVDHDAPHCKSNALFKGALQGKSARTVWIGDVLIRESAEGTQTYEMNRNLLLTPGSRADSVPNLEIETGEIVGAGHASATGRFDDEQLFYLMSRGIPSDVARRLVVRGFFGEVLLRLGVPSVVERASETIERELAITGY
ncbi:Fe-S cluster assembly protein SufD [Nakamurella lactea]|uniref:Fe-S cluster assembly protein SufD n=1 Tax=Nakamurella lactea TaxID=459515 RepID=UPI000490A541|nr:Fe-S cluster assembly protein SufD [Nakamurella lactea]